MPNSPYTLERTPGGDTSHPFVLAGLPDRMLARPPGGRRLEWRTVATILRSGGVAYYPGLCAVQLPLAQAALEGFTGLEQPAPVKLWSPAAPDEYLVIAGDDARALSEHIDDVLDETVAPPRST